MHGQSSGTDRFPLHLFASSMVIRYYDFPCGSSQADQGGISWLAANQSSHFCLIHNSTIFSGSRLEFRLVNGAMSIAHTGGQVFVYCLARRVTQRA